MRLDDDGLATLARRCVKNDVDRARLFAVRNSLRCLKRHVRGRVLDFGSGDALSMVALYQLDVNDVDGVEVVASEVAYGRAFLEAVGADSNRLLHIPDTRRLPFPDATFDTVLANAVFEHIAQPRDAYLREVWRVLKPGGALLVLETPNKYLPVDLHTTGLWGVPWMPSRLARAYAVWRRRYDAKKDWDSSGWRGLGYYELIGALPSGTYRVVHEDSRLRHRLFRSLGLPAGLLDPYWQLVVEKQR